jgi:signal transduction histidine kinase
LPLVISAWQVHFTAIPLTLRTNEPVTTTIAGDFSNAIARLRVEIADSGAGIDAESQKKLFSQFAQFSRNELQGGGGSGLGLWISRHIVEMHKGAALLASSSLHGVMKRVDIRQHWVSLGWRGSGHHLLLRVALVRRFGSRAEQHAAAGTDLLRLL